MLAAAAVQHSRFQWYWLSDANDGWAEYPAQTSQLLEQAFKTKKKTFNVDGERVMWILRTWCNDVLKILPGQEK